MRARSPFALGERLIDLVIVPLAGTAAAGLVLVGFVAYLAIRF